MPIPASYSQPVIIAILGLASAAHRTDRTEDAAPVLTISGKATAVATPTEFYAFTPTVYQNGERPLRFSIQNKPSWASFGGRHGTVYGVPQTAHAGTYANIIITVSDGNTTVHLPAFSISVPATAAQVAASDAR